MKTIDNDIKTGQFKQIYLLYGEEQYLIRQYRDKLKHALAADDDTMNFSAFSGSDINQKEDRKSTRLNSSHKTESRMPSSA